MSPVLLKLATLPRNRGFQVARVVLGTLLIAAAGLKAHGLIFDPLSEDSSFVSPRLQFAAVEVETVLGLWLLIGWKERAAWIAALGLFATLAAISFYSAISGQRSCGCLGRLPVNPWLAFAFDSASIAALAIWRPPSAVEIRPIARLRAMLKVGVGAVALLAIAAGIFLLAFDDPDEGLARLRGHWITVEPVVSQVGDGVPPEQRTFVIRLRNHSGRAVNVIGGTTTCSCIATEDLPINVPPGESRPINVLIKFTGGVGRFQHRFVLFTDDEKQRTLVAWFGGRVISPHAPRDRLKGLAADMSNGRVGKILGDEQINTKGGYR